MTIATLDALEAACRASGGTDFAYLRWHFARFTATKQRLLAQRDQSLGKRVLDIGAHWLHQAVLYAADGFEVTALDLAATFEEPAVKALAQHHAIRLLPNADLENPSALDLIADDAFDIVLFTEVIEHLAFNPVALWRQLYRVMKPGAIVVVTTPNYHALRAALKRWSRRMRGLGGGVPVQEILFLHTHSHHWKEYSALELRRYFTLLSPDFSCRNLARVEEYAPIVRRAVPRRIAGALERAVPVLRPYLYLEVELTRKQAGIVIQPRW